VAKVTVDRVGHLCSAFVSESMQVVYSIFL